MVLNSARFSDTACAKLAALDARTQLDDEAKRARSTWDRRLAHHRTPISSSTVSRLIMTLGDALVVRSGPCVLAVAILMIAIIGIVDLITGSEIALSLFYVFPIALVTWRLGKSAGLALSVVSVVVWLGANWAVGHTYSSPAIPYWNGCVRLGIFLIITFTLAEISTLLQFVQTDDLTGLANSRGFLELAMREFSRCERLQKGISLAYIDIDDFKHINDSYGHAGGDAVLRLFGATLQRVTRQTDIVARVGGDEFIILFVDGDESRAPAAMKKVEKELRAELARCDLTVTFTLGQASFDRVPESVEAAIGTADSLMYAAKRKGKNRINHRMFISQAEAARG